MNHVGSDFLSYNCVMSQFQGFLFSIFFMNSSSYTLNTLTTDAGAAYIVPEYDLEFRLYLLFWGNSFTAWLI